LKNEKSTSSRSAVTAAAADMGIGAVSATLTHKDYNCLVLLYDNESYAKHRDIQLLEFQDRRRRGDDLLSCGRQEAAHAHPVEEETCPACSRPATRSPRLHRRRVRGIRRRPDEKIRKALELGGPTFVHTLRPVPEGLGLPPRSNSQELGHLAVETRDLAAVRGHGWRVQPHRSDAARSPRSRKKRKPVYEYLKRQGPLRALHRRGRRALPGAGRQDVDRLAHPGVIPFTVPERPGDPQIDKKPVHEQKTA